MDFFNEGHQYIIISTAYVYYTYDTANRFIQYTISGRLNIIYHIIILFVTLTFQLHKHFQMTPVIPV